MVSKAIVPIASTGESIAGFLHNGKVNLHIIHMQFISAGSKPLLDLDGCNG